MSIYPQIGQGSIAQFPLRRTRKWRTFTNELESGEQILLPDTAAGQIEWYLKYTDLSDAEAKSIGDLFAASFGGWDSFLFIDPLANLLGWSEDLSKPDWQLGLLVQNSASADPMGTHRATSIANGSAGAQQLSQTLAVPGDYVACFSAWVRSDSVGAVTIRRDSVQSTVTAGPQWKRIFVSGAGVAGNAQSSFSLEIAAGQTLDVWGFQAEGQPYPSAYKQTTAARGIYEETYFGSDDLAVANDAPGLSSCSIKLISRV